MKKLAIGIAAIFAMLMMVSTVTAVPYEQQDQVVGNQRRLHDQLETIMRSPAYLRLQQIVNDNLPADKQQYVSDTLNQFFINKGIPLDIHTDLPFLALIADLILLILGHNIVGETLAFALTTLIALPYSLILGLGFMGAEVVAAGVIFLIAYAFCQKQIDQLWDQMWQQFFFNCGLIFGFIILGILGTILLVIGIPVWYIVSVVMAFTAVEQEMFDYLFNGQTMMGQKEQSQLIQGMQSTLQNSLLSQTLLDQNIMAKAVLEVDE